MRVILRPRSVISEGKELLAAGSSCWDVLPTSDEEDCGVITNVRSWYCDRGLVQWVAASTVEVDDGTCGESPATGAGDGDGLWSLFGGRLDARWLFDRFDIVVPKVW